MLFKKLVLLILIALSIDLAVFSHVAFIFPVLVLLHLLFNETDFFYRENSIYDETDLSRLFHKDAGPIEIVNYSDKAIIFVHGFPSCPNTFKYVAPLAEKAGYDVFVPLLPGFGTEKEDFIKSNFTQWFVYLCGYYLAKRRGYDKVYIVGVSLGGALTLKLAEKYSDTWLAPDGICVSGAPVFTNSIRQRIIKSWLLYSVRSLSWFIKFIAKPGEKWKEMEDGHSEWLGYGGLFPVQSYSIKIAIEKIRADLQKITVPIIALHAPEDRTVNYKNMAYIEKKISSEKKVFKTVDYKDWYNTHHILFLYESIRENLMKEVLTFFKEIEENAELS